jgi:hypothetical protein
VRASDYVDADHFAEAAGGFGAGVDGGANSGDVSTQGDGYEATTAATMPLVSIKPIASPFAIYFSM